MDDEIGYVGDFEQQLVSGAKRRLQVERRRRRIVAGVSAAVVAAVVGAAAVALNRGDGPEGVASSDITTEAAATPPSSALSSSTSPIASSAAPPPSSVSGTTPTSPAPPPPTTAATSLAVAPPSTTQTAPTMVEECDSDAPGSGEQFPIRRCDRGWGVVWVRLALEADGEPIVDGSVVSVFNDTVHEAVRRYQARHGLEVDGLVGPATWFMMYPEFQTPTGSLAQFDSDASGRIEPDEVRAIGDANAPCESTATTTCTSDAP